VPHVELCLAFLVVPERCIVHHPEVLLLCNLELPLNERQFLCIVYLLPESFSLYVLELFALIAQISFDFLENVFV